MSHPARDEGLGTCIQVDNFLVNDKKKILTAQIDKNYINPLKVKGYFEQSESKRQKSKRRDYTLYMEHYIIYGTLHSKGGRNKLKRRFNHVMDRPQKDISDQITSLHNVTLPLSIRPRGNFTVIKKCVNTEQLCGFSWYEKLLVDCL